MSDTTAYGVSDMATPARCAVAGIREAHRNALCSNEADVDRLLAAVDAALELSARWGKNTAPGSAFEEVRMRVRQECASTLRKTITSALLGEEISDG